MTDAPGTPLSGEDEAHLKRAIALAHAARAAGHRPFGAVVADGSRTLIETGSTQTPGGDPTLHAEMNAVRGLAGTPRETLARATLYSSGEPCPMCAVAAFYAGIGRIVYGFPEDKLRPIRNQTAHGAGVSMACRDALASVADRVTVLGPYLEEEAGKVHDNYWTDPA